MKSKSPMAERPHGAPPEGSDEDHLDLPSRFCWTKYGVESGEPLDEILARKERERQANGGVFLWGVGNCVTGGIRALVRQEKEPVVVFSPMRAKPKGVDVAPAAVVTWHAARSALTGEAWAIPPGSTIISREAKRHYALVCRTDVPLRLDGSWRTLCFGQLRNLVSGAPLGYSQVTSVVEHHPTGTGVGPMYPIGFAARLVHPYFIELSNREAAREPLMPGGGTADGVLGRFCEGAATSTGDGSRFAVRSSEPHGSAALAGRID